MRKITNPEDVMENLIGKRIMPALFVLLIVLFVVLVSIMFSDDVSVRVGHLLGIRNKIEIIQFIGLVISGVFAAIGLVVLSQRADAQMRTAKAQVENNRLVEKGHTQERFKTATKHLGHNNASVRTAAFYEFFYLIKDNEEYRKSIMDILYAHIRATTIDFANSDRVKKAKNIGGLIKPTEEIQGLLDILFKSHDIDHSNIKPNLQRVYFSGADLAGGNLSSADLSRAELSEVNFDEANLSDADLSKADLSGAKLQQAKLANANLCEANLFGANLSEANLSEAKFRLANLLKANAWGADMSRADLEMADLSHADLREVNLSIANLSIADLSGANLSGANLSNAQLGGATYTNKTQFPGWFMPPIVPPDNGDKVQFPEVFVAPKKTLEY